MGWWRPLIAALFVVHPSTAQQDERVGRVLARLAQEAERFEQVAPRILARETLRQRAAKVPPRLRVRVGEAARRRPPLVFQSRDIVSEYGYAALGGKSGPLHEFRRVVSVDGRPVEGSDKARGALTLALTSSDDSVKRRLLRDFEKYGLVGAAIDFGQSILLFTRPRLEDYEFRLVAFRNAGPDTALVLAFVQRAGTDAWTIFENRRVIRRRLEGELWVRQPDYLPLRIVLATSSNEGGRARRDEAEIDYAPGQYGALLPAGVVHRHYEGGQLTAENVFQYSTFRKFTVDAEIKFSDVPDAPAPASGLGVPNRSGKR